MLIVNRKINPTMVELIIGIIVYGIFGEILFTVLYFLNVPLERVFDDTIFNILIGFLIGIIYSAVMIIHMARTVETALDMGEHGALKHTRIAYIIRIVSLILLFVLMLIFNFGNIFAMLFGLFSLKLSAYAQPITHKVKEKIKKGR